MKSRIFKVLIGMMVLSMLIAACQPAAAPANNAPANNADAGNNDANVSEDPTEEVVEPTDEPAPLEPIRIGYMQDTSGALGLFGLMSVEGFEIGLDYATGGTMEVAGRPIEVIYMDDAGVPETGSAAARGLIEAEGVDIIAGNASSGVAGPVQVIAAENEIIYFSGPAASPAITGENWNPYTFRVCRNTAQDAQVLAIWAVENLGSNYIIFAEDYAFGQATAAGFQAAISDAGGTFLTEEPMFAPSDTVDFTPYIQEILTLDPDGIVLVWATPASGSILLEQFEAQGVTENSPFLTGFLPNIFVQTMDPGNIGSIGSLPYHYALLDTPANDYLTEEYQARFEKYPDLYSECGFATAQAIVAALEASEGDASPDALIPVLEGMVFEGPKGTYTIRAEDHQALTDQYIVELISVTDPDFRFFDLVSTVDAVTSAPPCTAPNCP